MFRRGGNSGPSPAQRAMGDILINESLHVLSTFELNRIASLTYGDDVCDEIFEMLEQIQRCPMEYSPLTVQKSLVITKHIMIYGSEKCVNSSLGLQRAVEQLLEFNTVLWAQKTMQGAAAFMYKLKGGGVDQGYPVREAASEVWPIMIDIDKLRNLRNSSADPNSLVPVGSQTVGFLSDDVRHFMLKRRILEQYAVQTKSNLVKEAGGFGSGLATKDGKMVVGAAHGLDEMMKMADRANRRFTDEGEIAPYELPTYYEPGRMRKPGAGPRPPEPPAKGKNQQQQKQQQGDMDFLSGDNSQQQQAPVGDLLDFSAFSAEPAGNTTGDLLGTGGGGSDDPFGMADLLGTGSSSAATAAATTSLGGGGLLNFDPSPAGMASANRTASSSLMPDLGLLSLSENSGGSAPTTTSHVNDPFAPSSDSKPEIPTDDTMPSITVTSPPMGDASAKSTGIIGSSVMSSTNEDRFAALDSLDIPAPKSTSSILSAKEAESRLLGGGSMASSSTPAITSSLTNSTSEMGNGVHSSAAASDPAMYSMDSGMMNPPPSSMSMGLGSSMPNMGLGGMDAPAMGEIHDPMSMSASGSGLKIASNYSAPGEEDDDDGFVMGGDFGAGLDPTAAAPSAPPPPPPPI